MSGAAALPRRYLAIFEAKGGQECAEESQICKDVQRTPIAADHLKAPMRESIHRILRATVHAQPHIGYVQGMNFIVSALLSSLSPDVRPDSAVERAAFLLLNAILVTYGLGDVYDRRMCRVLQLTTELEQAVEAQLPRLAAMLPDLYVA